MSRAPDSQVCAVCGDAATVHVNVARHRKWLVIHHACEEHAAEILTGYFSADLAAGGVQSSFDSAIPFDIELLVVRSDGPRNGTYYLQQAGRSRRFCCTMGYCESAALYLSIQDSTTSRRGPYATFARTIIQLGGSVQDVLVSGFSKRDNCFVALVRIMKADDLVEIDARLSDAINLAVVCNVPILVSQEAWRTYENSLPEGNSEGPKLGRR